MDGVDVEASSVVLALKLIENRIYIVSHEIDLYPDARRHFPKNKVVKGGQEKIRWLKGKWRHVQEFNTPSEYMSGAVDSESGETFTWDDRVDVNLTGGAMGLGQFLGPRITGTYLDFLPMLDMKVTLPNVTSVYVDKNGTFSIPYSGTSTKTVTTQLAGRWAKSIDQPTGKTLSLSGNVTPGVDFTFMYNLQQDPLQTAQVNGYFHASLAHDFVVANGVNPSGINKAIDVFVNIADPLSMAYFSPSAMSLNFSAASGSNHNMAFDTVILHEYGHFVDNAIGGMPNMGLSEGWGDVLATYITGQPLIGEGFSTYLPSESNYIRSAKNTYVYNPSDGQHTQGMAWAGFAWDLRSGLINAEGVTVGTNLANSLVLPVFLANSVDIPSAVKQVLIRDDDDGNLAYGTLHYGLIEAAARAHGIFYKVVPDANGPIVSAVSAFSADTSATISWLSDKVSTSQVEYGATTSYGKATSLDSNFAFSHNVSFTGLIAGNTYHFRVKSKDLSGNLTVSPDFTFKAGASLVVSNAKTSTKTSTSATITWTTNFLSDSQVNFGITRALESNIISPTLTKTHQVVLTGLNPGTSYLFQVVSHLTRPDGSVDTATDSATYGFTTSP